MCQQAAPPAQRAWMDVPFPGIIRRFGSLVAAYFRLMHNICGLKGWAEQVFLGLAGTHKSRYLSSKSWQPHPGNK